jgi:hypothetical protein
MSSEAASGRTRIPLARARRSCSRRLRCPARISGPCPGIPHGLLADEGRVPVGGERGSQPLLAREKRFPPARGARLGDEGARDRRERGGRGDGGAPAATQARPVSALGHAGIVVEAVRIAARERLKRSRLPTMTLDQFESPERVIKCPESAIE